MDATRKRRFKDEIYETFSRVGKALSNGHRLELLDLLSQVERSVEDLAGRTGMSVANTSQHLQVLRRAGLVTARREGVRAYYRLTGESAYRLWSALRSYAEAEMPAIDQVVLEYLTDREELDAIGADELRRRLETGEVILLDVRPPEEYEAGHIPGARSLPLAELEERIDTLPDDKEIVAYCRGRYCVYSDEAVQTLRDRGLRARRFEGGPRDWAGLRSTGSRGSRAAGPVRPDDAGS